MNSAKVASNIREQMRQFSGKVSVGLPKTAARLVREVLSTGCRVGDRCGSVRLPERWKRGSGSKVVDRLSRQLNRKGLRERVRENLLERAAPRVEAETLLLVDPTDLSKPYARKMQYLARVRDGSRGELQNGYWCCQVVAAWRGSAEVVPLYQELYSQQAPDLRERK